MPWKLKAEFTAGPYLSTKKGLFFKGKLGYWINKRAEGIIIVIIWCAPAEMHVYAEFEKYLQQILNHLVHWSICYGTFSYKHRSHEMVSFFSVAMELSMQPFQL